MTREEAVQSLLEFGRPLSELREAISRFPFDWDGPPLATLSRKHLLEVLARWGSRELTADEVAEWANLVEVRDDLEHADAAVSNAVFDLANPSLQGPLELVARLWSQRLDH